MKRITACAKFVWRLTVPASFIVVISSLVIWSFDNAPPIEIQSLAVRDGAVHRGGALVIDYDIVPHRACYGTLQRIIVDSQDVVQLVEPQHFTPATSDRKRTRLTVSVPVPVASALGLARYQAVIQYQCNPLQRLLGTSIDVRTPIVQFEVLPAGSVRPVPAPPDTRDDPDNLYIPLPAPAVPTPQRAKPRDGNLRTPDKMLASLRLVTAGMAPASPLIINAAASTCEPGKRRVAPYSRVVNGVPQHVRGYCRAE